MHPQLKTGIERGIYPVALAVSIFYLSGTSEIATPTIELQFLAKDKVAHFLVFGLLATLILRIDRDWRNRFRAVVLTITIVSTFGAFDEFRQSLTPGRYVEFADWLADTFGAATACIAYIKWRPYRNLLERRITIKGLRKNSAALQEPNSNSVES